MHARKLSTKLFRAYGIVILACFCMAALPLQFLLQRNYVSRATRKFEEALQGKAPRLRKAAAEGALDTLDGLCGELNLEFQGRVSILDREGHVVADSMSARCLQLARPDCIPSIRATREEVFGLYQPLNDTVTIRLPLELGPDMPVTIRLALPFRPVREQMDLAASLLWWSALAALALGVGITVWMSRRIAAPVVQMTGMAERIAGGDFDCPLDRTGNDEIGRLAESFDRMRRSLKATLGEVREQRNRAVAIMANMSDGVVSLEPDGTVGFCNAAAAELLGLPETTGQADGTKADGLPETVREAVARLGAGGIAESLELGDARAGERVLRISLTPVAENAGAGAAGVVLVVRDMTEAFRAETLGRELVANASHELRTPLAIIASSADTLLNEPDSSPEDRREFLEIISRHAVRMEQLVDETLQLSKLESGTPQGMVEVLRVEELTNGLIDLYRGAAATAGVALRRTGGTSGARVAGIESLLNTALVNLLENALRYTPAGGTIDVEIETGADTVRIAVRDTGPGIPPAEQKRIFERFVRGRSAVGKEGSGLGLAIVRRIAEIHSGEVRLESEPGRGSTFSLVLPAAPAGADG